LPHESTEVKKDVSLMDGYENGKHEGYGNEGSICHAFLLFRDNAECFFSFVSLRDRQGDEETCVDGSGNLWTAEGSVLFFIYTPVITISLVSKPSTTNKPILLAIVILSPTVTLSVPYLLLLCLGAGNSRLNTRIKTVKKSFY